MPYIYKQLSLFKRNNLLYPYLKTIVSCRLLMEEVQMEERVSEMEHSLLAEIERLQNEVESAKQGAELVCHTADNLRTEVANLESAITEKKRQVERLVADMKEANLQSLAVLPPEDQKMLLEGTTFIRWIKWVWKAFHITLYSFY